MASAHLKARGCGVQVIQDAIVPGQVEVERRGHIDLVEQQRARMLEDPRVLERLVVALRHGQNHDREVLAQVKVNGAHQVAHVLDEDDVDGVQAHTGVERIDGLRDHVALQVAKAAGVDLDGGHADLFAREGVHVRGDVALDHGAG